MNNGTHEITSTCTTIVRDMSQSPKNPAPKQGKGGKAGAKQEAAVTVPAPAGGAGADPASTPVVRVDGDVLCVVLLECLDLFLIF